MRLIDNLTTEAGRYVKILNERHHGQADFMLFRYNHHYGQVFSWNSFIQIYFVELVNCTHSTKPHVSVRCIEDCLPLNANWLW